jgi:hypothetical protein
MINLKKRQALLLLVAFYTKTEAQSFGAHPSGQSWSILNSAAINIIYPLGMENQAQRVANIMNQISDGPTSSVGDKRYLFDLVLHNKTTIANGFVSLAPARAEFFCTPPADNNLVGGTDWLDCLSIHEHRHMLQMANTRYGVTKLAYYLGGEQLWSAFTRLSTPNWYFEGDAVIAETALSNSGRGRLPFFTKEFRALAYENKNYSYQTLRNGSYKCFLPNHYPLGYLMLSKARKEKGNDICAKVLEESSKFKGVFYPFSKAMKRNTGYTTGELYDKTIADFYQNSNKEISELKLSPSTTISASPNQIVTKYQSPRYLSNGDIISIKSTYEAIEALYKTTNGKDEKLCSIGLSTDNYISVGNDIVAWTEQSVNPRRGYLNYSEIVLFDTKTKTKTRLTDKLRYFSPVVSKDGSKVAAINISHEQINSIDILDIKTGKVSQTLPNKDNAFLSRLVWLNDNEIASIAKQNGLISIVKFDLNGAETKQLSPSSYHNIDGLSANGNDIYFQSDFSGIDNIYKTTANGNKEIYQISSVPVGAYLPDVSPDGKDIIYSEINSMGYKITKASSSTATSLTPIVFEEPSQMRQFKTVANDSEGGDILHKTPTNIYKTEKYSGLFKGLKLHSWHIPLSISVPSISIDMGNILNDVKLSAGGGINLNEANSSFVNAGISINRYFPVINFNTNYFHRNTDVYSKNTNTIEKVKFSELSYNASVSIPLHWIRNNFTTYFNSKISYTHRYIQNINNQNINLTNSNFGSYGLNLSFGSIERTAEQNVGPRLGFQSNFNYTKGIGIDSEKLNLGANIFLPGLSANHNIVLKTAYQKELLSNKYQYSDSFEYSRGFTGLINDQAIGGSINYGFPLAYPDWGFGGITYFKRIRANLFYDISKIKQGDISRNYSSAGVDLILDNIHLNLIPLSIGIRSSYLLEGANTNKKTHFSVFLFMDL